METETQPLGSTEPERPAPPDTSSLLSFSLVHDDHLQVTIRCIKTGKVYTHWGF